MTRAKLALFSTITALLLSTHALAAGQQAAKPLTVEAIYGHGPLIGTLPEGLAWSPDGKHLTYRLGGELLEQEPGAEKARVVVSRAQFAAMSGAKDSEQDRDHRSRYGMASYIWTPDSGHLLFDVNGRLWLYDLSKGAGERIADAGEASGDDPKFSPNGKFVSFVREHGLAVVRLDEPGRPVKSLAPAPDASLLNGEVDWIYLEELEARSNYFWSPDSTRLAYLEMNEAAVPKYPISDWIPTHATVEDQRYPQPGDPNPAVRVGVVSADGGQTVWMTLPIHSGQDYIPRFGWVDAKTLWIETLARDQKHRDIYFADAATGVARAVLQLTDDKFFDDKYDVEVGDGSIVLTNWADGHSHLYLYSYNAADTAHTTAKLEKQLTQGEFEVSEVYRVDTASKFVDYASNEGEEQDQQIWQVSFAGERKQLTSGAGFHAGNFPLAGSAFVDKQSSRMEPPTIQLCAAGAKCGVIWTTHALDAFSLRAPQTLTVKAHDGMSLYATLLLPEGTTAASIPLIVNPYGGPGTATVENHWADALLFDELLAQHGFAVLHTDNRGMGGRGRAFAQAAYHNFGPVQLEDQLTVVDAVLAQFPQLDPKRLGWWGWSWGGTFTLYAMTHSDRFKAGVAVAPVTDWRDYDSIYTERYLSQPTEYAAGYKDFSVVNSAANLKGKLLIAHGTGDDNVHIENTVQFVQKLIEAEIPYDLQIYPRKTHSISGADVRTHLFNRILAHLEENLKAR